MPILSMAFLSALGERMWSSGLPTRPPALPNANWPIAWANDGSRCASSWRASSSAADAAHSVPSM